MKPIHTLALLALAACTSPEKREAAVLPYDSDLCAVMDSKLGSMGDPVVRVYEGRELKFCCQPCVDEFESDPQTYLKRLDEGR